jgi:hypothetical protein
MPRMKSTALVVAGLLALGSTAAADTKSWAALKGKFPAATDAVLSVDLTAVAKTQSWAKAVEHLFAAEPDAKQAIDTIKQACNIDVLTAITDVTVFGTIDKDEDFNVAIGLTGVDQAKTSECLQKIMDMMAGPKSNEPRKVVTAKTKGKVTEYTATGEAKKLYLAWIAKDVLVVAPSRIDQKGVLEKVIAGKAPKGDFKGMLAKVNKASPVFGVVAAKEKEDGINFLGGFGDVGIASGTLSIGLHLVTATAEEATKMVTMAKEGQAKAVQELNTKKQPDLAKVVGAATFSAAANEVTIGASIGEAVLLKVLPELDHIF